MRTRTLGLTGEELTTIGLGTWALGGGDWAYGWGPQEDAKSIEAIHRALDLGINWIDTARIYGLGHAEEVVGKAIGGRRRDIFLATKCSRWWDADGKIYGKLDAASVRDECESSLRRLKVDVIDLYQIHWPYPRDQVEEGWTTIAELISEGKVRYGGVSNFNLEQLKRVQAIHPVASLQPPYNMMRRDVENEILPYCAENDIGVLAYSPMMSGLLTGKYGHKAVDDLPDEDWRRKSPHFQEPERSVNFELADRLKPIAERNHLTLSQLSIAWVLRRDDVTSAIVGARRADQIEETAPAGDAILPTDDIQEIAELLDWRDAALLRAAQSDGEEVVHPSSRQV